MEIRECSNEELPEQLQHIPNPPQHMWLQGYLPEKGTALLTVVGSRALSPYGRQACESLIGGLSGYPISIVSGLALGADACAHHAALRAGLHTIAIPGSGLGPSTLYPRAHVGLAHDIVTAGGALLSEHPPDHAARIYDFPSRNRIMVGMSTAVLMIEAGSRSGTLITARLAADYNRTLLCVPHRITDTHGFGSHLFIRLGATLVTEPIHILEALSITPRASELKYTPADLSKEELLLLSLLNNPLSRDELVRASTLPSYEVQGLLGILELKGMLEEKFGMIHRI